MDKFKERLIMSKSNIAISTPLLRKDLEKSLNTSPIKGVAQGTRNIRKGMSGKRVVFFPSVKNKALMPCESRLEADNCLELEFNDSVLCYQTQPFTFNLGGRNSYTPDTLHKTINGDLVVREVKFSGSLEDPLLINRLQNISNALSADNVSFEIQTEQQLQIEPSISNYKLLYRCSHLKFESWEEKTAVQLIKNNDQDPSLKTARLRCDDEDIHPLIIDSLLKKGVLSYDKRQLLTPSSLIWINRSVA